MVGFAFGYRGRRRPVPGVSNHDLAGFIATRFSDRPLILQHEIADAMPTPIAPIHRVESHRVKGRYLDTREVARQAVQLMKNAGHETAIIVAHPHHVPRADAVCRRLGMQTVVPTGIAARFDRRSQQPWTRRQPAWSVRESLAIAHYAVRRWI